MWQSSDPHACLVCRAGCDGKFRFCRPAAAMSKELVDVERWAEDGLANEFVPMTIDATGDPCVQIVDVVKAGRLRQPVVDYRVTARIGDEIVAQERRALRVGTTAQGM